MPGRCDSPSAASGLPQGNRARCPERWPRDNDGGEDEFMEGLKLPPSASCGVHGRMGSVQGRGSALLEPVFAGSLG